MLGVDSNPRFFVSSIHFCGFCTYAISVIHERKGAIGEVSGMRECLSMAERRTRAPILDHAGSSRAPPQPHPPSRHARRIPVLPSSTIPKSTQMKSFESRNGTSSTPEQAHCNRQGSVGASSHLNVECDRERPELTKRLRAVLGTSSNAEIARLTSHHAETIRRYRCGAWPSALFLIDLCRALDIDTNWLLLGRHSPSVRIVSSYLQQVPTRALLEELLRRHKNSVNIPAT